MTDTTDDVQQRPIEQLWRAYAEHVLQMDPDATAAAGQRHAFFAGCMGLFGLLCATGDNDVIDDTTYQMLCQIIHDELFPHVDEVASHFETKH